MIEGTGEPVLNICGMEPIVEGSHDNVRHTGIPNFSKTPLPGRFQLISYNNFRVGSGAEYATVIESGNQVDTAASDCFVLLQHLNISNIHVFAHRQVGYAALKLAIEHPDLVKSIAFLDFEIVNSFALNPKVQQAMARVMQRTQMNPQFQQRMEMMRQMMESGTMPNGEPIPPEFAAKMNSIPKSLLDQYSPGNDADPALTEVKLWSSRMLSISYDEVASKIRQPILDAIYAEGKDWESQSAELLKGWLPQTEVYTIPKKAHWFSGQNDEGLAAGLADFYSRHEWGSL